MSDNRQMENDVVARFTAEVYGRFHALHAQGAPLAYLVGSALSGQDHDLADYLFGARGRFALIEFKADRAAVRTEIDKRARRRLLELCLADTGILRRAQRIHHFAWETLRQVDLPLVGKSQVATIDLARYIPELAEKAGVALDLAKSRCWTSDEFITSYLETETAGANIRQFRRYLEELYAIAGKAGSTELGHFQGAVFMYFPGMANGAQIKTIRFTSFEHLMDMTINYERTLTRQHDRAPSRDLDRGRGM